MIVGKFWPISSKYICHCLFISICLQLGKKKKKLSGLWDALICLFSLSLTIYIYIYLYIFLHMLHSLPFHLYSLSSILSHQQMPTISIHIFPSLSHSAVLLSCALHPREYLHITCLFGLSSWLRDAFWWPREHLQPCSSRESLCVL